MKKLMAIVVAVSCLSGAGSEAQERPQEPVVGLPCEGCEAVFDGLPATLESSSRIASQEEPGQPLRILGRVFDLDGNPAPGIIVYAYQTDSRGVYPTDESLRGTPAFRHGKLRGWAMTDEQGRYRFDTIRPAGYPGTEIPEHVHMHVIEVGRCTYYIEDIFFDDDPRLTLSKRGTMLTGRGGNGLSEPQLGDDGIWTVTRDIHLGMNIPGYPE